MTTMLDPLASYSFFVDITGVTVAQFKEVTGLGISIGIVENRSNQLKGQPILQKMPGSVKYDDIHLSRGKVADPSFWKWMQTVQEGKISDARKDGSIILYDYAHGEVTRYNFFDAWPSRVEIGKLTAGADTVLLESVVLTIGRLEFT
jgi:phage tail-like protein